MIKKILLTLGLLGIGLVNFSFGYTVNNNCFTHPTNNQIYYTCIDLELGEDYNIYTTNGIENTVNNGFSFISSGGNNYLIGRYYNGNNVYTISFFNEQGYFNTFNSWYDINDNNINNTRARYYSGLHYCRVEDTTQEINFRNCISNYYLNSNTNLVSYTHTIEDTLQFINNSSIKSWKIIYEYEEIPYILCGIFNNNKGVCVIPLGNGYRNSDANYCSTDSCLYSGVSLERIGNLSLNDILNNLDNYGISQSPFYSNSGGVSGSVNSGFDTSTGQYVELTGNLVYSDEKCTVGEIIDYAQGAGYNRYLCFGGLDNFDDFDSSLTYSPIPGTGKTLGQILSNAMGTWDTPNDWFDFWNGLYQDRNNYTAMRESYPAVYRTWFDLYYQYGGSNLIFDSVNEYCTMISLVSDYTQLYNGTYFKNTCQNYIIPKRNINSSDNVVGIDWGGVLGNSTGNTQMQSSKSFISNLFTKIKSNFRVPNRSDFGAGILPSYIIWALLGLIIFRFLSH